MNDDDLVKLIKYCRVFASLDYEVCHSIANLFLSVDLPQNQILFKQNDPSVYLYILTSGTLIAISSTPTGDKIVGSIEAGQTVGELGALSGELRSLTIKATSQCRLLKLESKHFVQLCHQYPKMMMDTMKPIIEHSQKNLKLFSSTKEGSFKAIVYDEENKEKRKLFEDNLLTHIPPKAKFKIIFNSEMEEKVDLKALDELKQNNSLVIFVLDCGDTPLSKLILQKTDTLFVVANGERCGDFSYFSKSILSNDDYKKYIRFELVLLHSEKKEFPKNTKRILDKAFFMQHHHIRINHEEDYQRFIRFMSGNAIGLVLGGGFKRGWLHIGVMKAMLDANIPIDAIGGTSIGSVIAGGYLTLHEKFDRVVTEFEYALKKISPPYIFADFTFPLVSLLNAKSTTTVMTYFFEDKLIEDLWKPCYTVTTNLSSYKEEEHHTGLIRQKVAGSSSIPGLFPPVVIDGQLHFDGCVCNNLPADVMKKIVGETGKVISVGLMSFHDKKTYNFPPILNFKDLFMHKFKLKKSDLKFPEFFDTFYGILTFGSFMKEKKNRVLSDIIINPNLNDYNMVQLRSGQAEELVQLGYNKFMEALALNSWKYDKLSGCLMKI